MPAQTYERYEGAGEAIPDAADTSNHLPLKPRKIRAQFTLCHVPTRWAWDGDHGWYPDLTAITHKPGCNGVQADKGGPDARINPVPAIAAMQAVKGAVILDRKDKRIPGGDYLRRHRTKTGQWHHALTFESWSKIGNGKLRKRFDLEGYIKWLRELEAAGLIPQMAEEILEDKLEVLEKRISRYQNDPRIGMAAVEIGLNAAVEKRDKMIADWQRQYSGEPVKGKEKK